MTATLEKAWGYQGDNLNLPVQSVEAALPFHVQGLESLLAEFKANGFQRERSDLVVETHDDVTWRVFYVVAPDGLCYWFGERE